MTKNEVKNTKLMFFATELIIFAAQVFVFFLVAVFTSDFLRSEERLTEFIKTKINNNTWGELGFTLLAITVALGVISIIKQISTSRFLDKIAQEVFIELARTIYVFGSSVTAIMLAVSVFLYNKPQPTSGPAKKYFIMAGLFAITTFIYGFGFKALLAAKAHDRVKAADAKTQSLEV